MPPIEEPAVDLVYDARSNLGEGALWDHRTSELVWVDIMAGAVHRLDPLQGCDRVVEIGQPVGAAALRAAGGLVLAVRDGFGILQDDAEFTVVASTEADVPTNRMNDAKCDSQGRLWAGTMAFALTPGASSLYRFDADHGVTTMLTGMTLANGLGWSPDDTKMYLIDSLAPTLSVFDFDPSVGLIENQRPLVSFEDGDGSLPDGMTVDAEGFLWVAVYGAGQLRRYAPDGSLDRVVRLPVTQPTSCTFGGSDMRDMYVTTANQLLSPEERAKQPSLGGVFRWRPGVEGLPANMYRG